MNMEQMTAVSEDRRNAIFVMESLRSGIPTRLSTRLLPDLRKNITDQIHAEIGRAHV